jgi:IclR family pca regulon transcriptional regulator
MSDEELDSYLERTELVARTPRAPVTADEVKQRVQEARAAGCAVTNEDLEAGLLSIAVPVKDTTGRTVATMSVSTSTSRVAVDDFRARFEPALRRRAEMLGRQL